MHFVYKLDHLLRRIVFKTKTHLLKRHLIFLTYFNSRLFVNSIGIIPSNIPKFQPFLTSFAIFHAFTDFFTLNDPEIEKHYKWTLKRLKLGKVSSFHQHSMCQKVERVMEKSGCTLRINWTISFEVWGFRTKTHMLQRQFIFFSTYLNSRLFVHSICTIPSHTLKFQPFLTSFACFMHLMIFLAKWH